MSSRQFIAHHRAAALQCVSMMFHTSGAGRKIAASLTNSELNGHLEDVADIHSRRNMALLDTDNVKNMCAQLDPKRHVHDGGLPELITEVVFTDDDCYLNVVGARNIAALDVCQGGDVPVVISLKGPQSLYGTGLFPVMEENNMPQTLVCGTALTHIPCMAISRETLEMPKEDASKIASFMEGFTSAATMTPHTQGGLNPSMLEAGKRHAIKSDCPEALSIREVMDVAVRKAVSASQEPAQRAKRATDVGYRDFM